MQITKDTSAIVTGGASGLGLAAARALRAAGIKVAIFDVNAAAGSAAASELGAEFCEVNVMSEESCSAGFEKARAANGQERIFVACAGGGRAGKIVSNPGLRTGDTAQSGWKLSMRLDDGGRHA